jgi:hypothetical protein
MGVFHAAAGALFTIGWFIFADGAAEANKTEKDKYEFVECLPGILCMVAMVMMLVVSIESISDNGGGDGDMFGGGGGATDADAVMRHKVLFFFAAMVFLSGLTVAVWLQAAKYKGSDNWWPGVALTLQALCFMGSSFCLGASKLTKPRQDDGMAF